MAERQPLTVRVGIGWNPFEGDGLRNGRFWGMVDALEDYGYDSIWMSDSAGLGGASPLAALAAVGARTEYLKLGTGVLVMPPRNPVLLAREMATIDVLSGGRFLPAGGLGINLPAELAAMGVPKGERAARLEESIAIIKELWSGEGVTREGRFWSLEDVTLNPRPVRGKLEFWLGGLVPAALRRVGRVGDGWLASYVGPAEFPGMVDAIRDAAAEAGRSIDEDHYGTTLFAAPDEAAIPAEARTLLDRRPGLEQADHIAIGTSALRTLLERFIAAGASKFVVIPFADDMVGWLRKLRLEAIEPVET